MLCSVGLNGHAKLSEQVWQELSHELLVLLEVSQLLICVQVLLRASVDLANPGLHARQAASEGGFGWTGGLENAIWQLAADALMEVSLTHWIGLTTWG